MVLARAASYKSANDRFLPVWNRLATLLSYLLLALLCFVIAKLVWALMPGQVHKAQAPVAPISQNNSRTVQASNSKQVNLASVAALHIFGAPVAADAPAKRDVVTTAPETRLNLRLTGIYRADDVTLSRAIIGGGSEKNGREHPYAEGDSISNGVELHEIFDEYVVLKRNGSYETLYLKTADKRSTTAQTNSRPSTTIRPRGRALSAEVGQELRGIRDELLRNPQRAGELIRIQPVNQPGSSQIQGYRVYPGKDRALFNRVGLRSGDLVTAVNGQSLQDPAQGFKILSDLTNASQISLEINRRGQTQNLSVDLNQ